MGQEECICRGHGRSQLWVAFWDRAEIDPSRGWHPWKVNIDRCQELL